MQKIERFGVLALVFLLVTILAVSLWGEGQDGGLFNWGKSSEEEAKAPQFERPRPKSLANSGSAQARPGVNPGAAQAPGAGIGLAQPSADQIEQRRKREEALARFKRDAEARANALPTPGTTPGATQPQGQLQGQLQAQPSELAQAPLTSNATPLQAPAAGAGAISAPGTVVRPGLAQSPAAGQGARTYVVKSGDTLGEIARRELGSSARWTEIQALNANLDPKRLRLGAKLLLPSANAPANVARATTPAAATPAAKSAVNGARTYTIKSGDTLSAVAQRELGSAQRWNEIAALNPYVDPTALVVGARIALPGDATQPAPATGAAAPQRSDVVAYGAPRSKSKVQ